MARMVISGSDPNLRSELICSMTPTGLTVPDQSIILSAGQSLLQVGLVQRGKVLSNGNPAHRLTRLRIAVWVELKGY